MTVQNWFITGVSSGLGKSMAEAALAAGHQVAATFRRRDQAEAFRSAHSKGAWAYLLDVTDMAAIPKVIATAEADMGPIDVLVNNAGIGMVGAVEESSMKEAKALFEANFFGALRLTQSVLPSMRRRGSGHIIQISSHGGLKAFAGFGMYNASKFALEGMSEALAQEVGPLGIQVTLVEPGPFRTGFAGAALREAGRRIDDYKPTAGVFQEKLRSVHGKQEGDPEKAAQAIVSIAGKEDAPLRLPLGRTALHTIAMKLDSVREDLEAARSIALGAVFS